MVARLRLYMSLVTIHGRELKDARAPNAVIGSKADRAEGNKKRKDKLKEENEK